MEEYPASLQQLSECEPQYETFEGWQSDTSQARTMDDLPAKAQDYIRRLQDASEVAISLVSVGPSRESYIELDANLARYAF